MAETEETTTKEVQEDNSQEANGVDYKSEFEKYKKLYHKTNKENAERRKTAEQLEKELEEARKKANTFRSKYETLETKLTNQQRESKVSKAASSLGMDADLTIAHLHRKGKISEIDDETDLNKLLESELKDKPNLKVNGAVNTGDTGDENDTSTKSDFNKWIRGKLQ